MAYGTEERKTNQDRLVCKDIEYDAREAIGNVTASKCVSILLVPSYMSNVAKRWGMTNIYRTNEIFSLVFINHELDSKRGEGTLVLYDTNQKILYDTV